VPSCSRTTTPTSSRTPDKRIIFAIPYEGDFTLVGTTDVEHHGAVGEARIDAGRDRLPVRAGRAATSSGRSTPAEVVWTYSGVRPLLDDESGDPAA
jgi:glycerol-3-phosphate dehydrogenase